MKALTLLLSLLLCNEINAQHYAVGNNIHFQIANQSIHLPSKQVKFARQIVNYPNKDKVNYSCKIKKKKILAFVKNSSNTIKRNYIELSKKQEAVFKFKKNSIRDVNGIDLYIFSEENLSELKIFVSKNGKDWTSVGKVNGKKKYINLAGKIPHKEKYTYVKIKSLSGSQTSKINQVASIKSNGKELGLTAKIVDGTVHTNSDKIKLQIKDFRIFDGDLVSVKVNGRMLTRSKLLTKWNRFVEIPLKEGENKIIVKAKTEGFRKPNTIDLKILDGIIINIGSYRIKKKRTKTIKVMREVL